MMTLFGNEAPLPGTNAKPHMIDIVSLLGRTRRFGGNANLDWSVLSHSMLCAMLWLQTYGPEGVEHALMHDAHEAYLGDIPTPVKNLLGRDAFEKVAGKVDMRIYEMLSCGTPDSDSKRRVKYVDSAALFIEAYYVATPLHLKHIIDSSVPHMDPETRKVVFGIVRTSCPLVADEMVALGFFEKPYEVTK
jgi:hypothetical protein